MSAPAKLAATARAKLAGASPAGWILTVGVLAVCLPAFAGPPLRDGTPAFRGVWADAFHPGFRTSAEIDALVARAVQGNYNAIVAEVMGYQDAASTGHGAYWNSSILPKANGVPAGFDPLAYLVTQAHAAGIEVHAWLVPYRISTSWPPAGNTTVAAHPQWVMVSQSDMGSGPRKVEGYYFLDPGSPEVQEYLVAIVRELVSGYAIDGINLDYIRYVDVNAGYPADVSYGASSLARFQDWTGYVGVPAYEGDSDWNDFRRQTIDELVRRLAAEIAAIDTNPRQPLSLTADLITWGNASSNFTYTSSWTLFQNWRLWMQQGWLDAGIPMNYKREYDSAQAQWYRNWVDQALEWRYGRHIYAGQGNYMNSKADSVAQLTYSLGVGADGTCNYSYYATADENMNGSWETDWSWYPYVAANLFTSPAPTPVKPWRDPLVSTEGMVWGQVVDDGTGLPVEAATVEVFGFGEVLTDGNGIYVASRVPAATDGTPYDIEVRAEGCPPVSASGVIVPAGGLVRQDVRVCLVWAGPGDFNEDGVIDFTDFAYFAFCYRGPGWAYNTGHYCTLGDADGDMDLDLADLASFQMVYGGGSR